jgi:hypothetical protein
MDHCVPSDMQMAFMGGVEGAAENPDPAAAAWQAWNQGRTWPAPRMT